MINEDLIGKGVINIETKVIRSSLIDLCVVQKVIRIKISGCAR